MKFKTHTFPGDDTDYVAPSWFELQQLSFDIAKQIHESGKTIDRIINAFPADQQAQTRTMLAESLRAVIAQQLLKTKDGKGRCAANEILIGSGALASMIREGKISQVGSMIQTGTAAGMQTMDQHLMQLIKEDRITKEAAYEKAIDKKLFA